MENQHRKIEGYRELDESEIAAMNEVKNMAKEVGAMIAAMEAQEDLDQRWVSIAKTHLQQGFMAATRAIAKPEFF